MEYGTTVEFWEKASGAESAFLSSPRPNAVTQLAHRDYFASADIEVEGRTFPSIQLFDRTMVDDVEFPIDAVYTWVDGADPVWRGRFDSAVAVDSGHEYHGEARAANRYDSRDELRFSLRSLDMYAPWIRHVYLVTDGQVPDWLDVGNDRITVVDHRDIFADQSMLPVFNSNSIITQLHHIDGLSEHYLYLNDDMFFGRDVRPDFFWLPSGIAKVFPSRQRRPYAPIGPGTPPHLNITTNIRHVMESCFGRSVSTAIRHTPYPQLRSVNYEIEERFPEIVANTARHRFRHHTDIALDQLFHYYAQATGRAVASSISYDYVNIGSAESLTRLRQILIQRHRSVFCLNDAPEPGVPRIPDEQVTSFLEHYFPVASMFETRS
jgi:hypothetical protein